KPQPPEVAGVASAVAIGRPARELGALRRLAGGTARHGRGIEQPQPVAERGRDARQLPDERADLRRERAQPLVVARLLGDVREQVRQALTGQPNKPPLGMTPKYDLRDRQRDELGIGDLRATACTL